MDTLKTQLQTMQLKRSEEKPHQRRCLSVEEICEEMLNIVCY